MMSRIGHLKAIVADHFGGFKKAPDVIKNMVNGHEQYRVTPTSLNNALTRGMPGTSVHVPYVIRPQEIPRTYSNYGPDARTFVFRFLQSRFRDPEDVEKAFYNVLPPSMRAREPGLESEWYKDSLTRYINLFRSGQADLYGYAQINRSMFVDIHQPVTMTEAHEQSLTISDKRRVMLEVLRETGFTHEEAMRLEQDANRRAEERRRMKPDI